MDNYKKIYTITIAEPWDFESPDGENIICGTVLSIVNNYLLVFKANYLLSFNGIIGDILILSPRFKDGSFENITTEEVNINGGLFLDDYGKGFEEDKLKKNSRFVLIGTLDS